MRPADVQQRHLRVPFFRGLAAAEPVLGCPNPVPNAEPMPPPAAAAVGGVARPPKRLTAGVAGVLGVAGEKSDPPGGCAVVGVESENVVEGALELSPPKRPPPPPRPPPSVGVGDDPNKPPVPPGVVPVPPKSEPPDWGACTGDGDGCCCCPSGCTGDGDGCEGLAIISAAAMSSFDTLRRISSLAARSNGSSSSPRIEPPSAPRLRPDDTPRRLRYSSFAVDARSCSLSALAATWMRYRCTICSDDGSEDVNASPPSTVAGPTALSLPITSSSSRIFCALSAASCSSVESVACVRHQTNGRIACESGHTHRCHRTDVESVTTSSCRNDESAEMVTSSALATGVADVR